MSWSEVFPILTDEMVDAYQTEATAEEKATLVACFAVEEVINAKPEATHILSTSLFCKNIRTEMPQIVISERAQVLKPNKRGLKRFDPWDHYVAPVLKGAYCLGKNNPKAVFRVYLAADMRFLVPDLVMAGCEVFLMKSNSIAHNPGAMWRMLAFEDAADDRLVTIIDADRAAEPESDMARTEEMKRLGLGWWRVPVWGELNEVGNVSYRPFIGGQSGCCSKLDSGLLMQALAWNTNHGKIDVMAKLPGTNSAPVHGAEWLQYGFDEYFLLSAIYPRAAFDGILSLVPAEAKSRLLPLDIEYTQWANNKSEIVYFGRANNTCCEPGEDCKPMAENAGKAKKKAKEKPVRLLNPSENQVYVEWANSHKSVFGGKKAAATSSTPIPAVTLVIARYREDIHWLLEVPKEFRVVVYNKGDDIQEPKLLKRINQLVRLPNAGRESDTYLQHLLRTDEHGPSTGFTVFCQGDPFGHAPDLLKLLKHRRHWKDVQPLTLCWKEESQIPPQFLLEHEKGEWVEGCRVRTQAYSTWTMDMTGFIDQGSRDMMNDYLKFHRLINGYNISAHFLDQCGLPELAKEAWGAEQGRFTFGAIFAVRNNRLKLLPKEALPGMIELAASFFVHGYIFKRMWLHFFGLPFKMAEATLAAAKLKPASSKL